MSEFKIKALEVSQGWTKARIVTYEYSDDAPYYSIKISWNADYKTKSTTLNEKQIQEVIDGIDELLGLYEKDMDTRYERVVREFELNEKFAISYEIKGGNIKWYMRLEKYDELVKGDLFMDTEEGPLIRLEMFDFVSEEMLVKLITGTETRDFFQSALNTIQKMKALESTD